METVEEIAKELVQDAITRTLADPQRGAKWFERRSGSVLDGINVEDGEAVASWLRDLPWEDVTAEAQQKGCRLGFARYYRANIDRDGGVIAYEAIKLLGELTEGELARVKVRRGAHHTEKAPNIEIVLEGLEPSRTSEIHVIVADTTTWPPAAEPTLATGTVVTWYPGRLTAPVATHLATVKRG